MERDYDLWNIEKQFVQERYRVPHCKVREVWWCSLGINIGDEENGKGDLFDRPVLIYEKFGQNLFLCIPVSSHARPDGRFYLQVNIRGSVQSLLLSHLRTVDFKRLSRKIGKLSVEDFQKTKQAIRVLLG